jgi:hypothetical protein
MLGKAEARSPAHLLYERSKQLVIDARVELEDTRLESESSLPKSYGRPKKRSFTTPDHVPRLQDPPILPPGYQPSIVAIQTDHQNSFFAPQNSSSRDGPYTQIPSQFGSTSEPEGFDNSRLSPTDVAKGKYAENWAEFCQATDRNRSPKHEAAIPGHAPSDSENSLPPLVVASETRYESPSPPRSQPAIPTTHSPPQPSPIATAGNSSPHRSSSTRHSETAEFARPQPLVIQREARGTDPLYLSLESASEWRRKRNKKHIGTKNQLQDAEWYMDRIKDRDHVSVTNNDNKLC